MPVVINSLKSGHTHMHANTHAYRCAHKETILSGYLLSLVTETFGYLSLQVCGFLRINFQGQHPGQFALD